MLAPVERKAIAYNFSVKNCPQNSARVQVRFHSPERCIIRHLKNTKLYSVEHLRTEMTSDPSNYHREHSPDGSDLFQIERSDVISVLKKSLEYSFVFFKCLLKLMKSRHKPSQRLFTMKKGTFYLAAEVLYPFHFYCFP